jgi:hypothetical protein
MYDHAAAAWRTSVTNTKHAQNPNRRPRYESWRNSSPRNGKT